MAKTELKQKIKSEIDKLPHPLLEEVYQYIKALKRRANHKRRWPTFHLGGRFDNLDIRKEAYKQCVTT